MTDNAASWRVWLAVRRGLLEKRLHERVVDCDPGQVVVVVRSAQDERRLARALGPAAAVTTLARFLGRVGPDGIEDEDLLPDSVPQWLVEEALPEGYRATARHHLASVFLEAILWLEQNGLRPRYPETGRSGALADLEAAHEALLDGLEAHHEAGRFAAFERVSRACGGASRFGVAYPAAHRVLLFGIDRMSPAERRAVEHVVPGDVDVDWFVLGRPPGSDGHPGLEFSDPLVRWLKERAFVESLPGGRDADDDPERRDRMDRLSALFAWVPAERKSLRGVSLDAPGSGDEDREQAPPRDRVEEAHRLFSRVRGLLDQGVEPPRIGVVVPALQDYAGLLEDLAAEYGVDVSMSYRGPLRTSPPGSFLGSLLDVLDSGLSRDRVLDLVVHPLASFPVQTDDPEFASRFLDGQRLRNALLEAGTNPRGRKGPGGWEHALQGVLRRRQRARAAKNGHRQDGDERDPFVAQISGLARLVEQVDALGAGKDPVAFVVGLRSLMETARVRQGVLRASRHAADPAYLLAAHRGVVELLDEVEEAFSIHGQARTRVGSVREVIRRLLAQREVPLPVDPDVGVQVVSWRDARSRVFDHAFVVGATQDALPEPEASVAVEELLREAFGDRLERLDRAAEARRVMHQILADTKQVVFSAPRLDAEAPLVRSVLLDELAEAFELERPPVAGDRLYSRRGAARRAVLEERSLSDPPAHLPAARRLVRERARSLRASLYTGRILDERARALTAARPVVAKGAVSAGRLSQYARCAFRSFVVDGLRVRAPWERDEELDPRDKGDVLHEVLERFLREAIRREGTPFRLTAGERQVYEDLLLQAALAGVAENRRRSVAFQAFEASLLGGLPGGSNPYSGAPPGLLVRFLDTLEAFGAGEGIVGVEVGFAPERQTFTNGEPDDVPAGAAPRDGGQDMEGGEEGEREVEVQTPVGPVPVRGRIDRLDRIGDGHGGFALRVVEYKSGALPSREAVRGGVEFQLPLYAVVAGLLDPGQAVGEAAYHQMKRPRRDEAGIARTMRFTWGGKHDLEELVARTPQRVGEILGAQRAGWFPLTLLDEEEAGCKWCELRRGCGLRPETTGLRREAARRAKREEDVEDVGYVPDRVDLPVAEGGDGEGEGGGGE